MVLVTLSFRGLFLNFVHFFFEYLTTHCIGVDASFYSSFLSTSKSDLICFSWLF